MRVILNADDLGYSPAVNRAVLELHNQGLLSRASLVTNLPHSAEALEMLPAYPDLRVGVHLNLTKGEPCLPLERIPSLVDSDGRFYATPILYARALTGRVDLEEAESELRAQIDRAQGATSELSHLDSHSHWHALPPLRSLIHKLAEAYEIPRGRPADPRRALLPNRLWLSAVETQPSVPNPLRKADYLLSLHHWLRAPGDPRPDFHGERLHKLLSRPGVTLEMVTHPGYAHDPDFPRDNLGPERREWELDFLLSPAFSGWLERMGAGLVRESN